ncbi:MAG: hypothetical protein Q7T80_06520 [Methanoregula sp.]|nr:hypothetical protein [Methanoregula sp.]
MPAATMPPAVAGSSGSKLREQYETKEEQQKNLDNRLIAGKRERARENEREKSRS